MHPAANTGGLEYSAEAAHLGSMARRPGGSLGRRGSGRHRRRTRANGRSAAPSYALALVALLTIALGGVMAWQAVEYFLHSYGKRASPTPTAALTTNPPHSDVWTQDVLLAFSNAAQQVKSGDVMAAEVQVDEGVAEMEEARVRSKTTAADFFSQASAELDAILRARQVSVGTGAKGFEGETGETEPSAISGRLFEHVTQARVELAAMRSFWEPLPSGTILASDAAAGSLAAPGAAEATRAPVNLAAGLQASATARPFASHVLPNGPREIAANTLIDPSSVGGNFLDASLLPDTSEIFLPPATRQFSDNVRVENLTIAGASQTLDGIHWRNVTFIATRLRYEDGPLDLQNVRFVHCTFGFPSGARAAAIAKAIALGQTSLTVQ